MTFSSANTDVLPYVRVMASSGMFSSETQPTLEQVTNIISQVDGEIMGVLKLASIYTVSTSLTPMLKKYSAMGSAGLVTQTYGEEDGNFQKGSWFYQSYQDWIDKVMTDTNYQNSLFELNTVENLDRTYIADNVTAGFQLSSSIEYIDEDFKP